MCVLDLTSLFVLVNCPVLLFHSISFSLDTTQYSFARMPCFFPLHFYYYSKGKRDSIHVLPPVLPWNFSVKTFNFIVCYTGLLLVTYIAACLCIRVKNSLVLFFYVRFRSIYNLNGSDEQWHPNHLPLSLFSLNDVDQYDQRLISSVEDGEREKSGYFFDGVFAILFRIFFSLFFVVIPYEFQPYQYTRYMRSSRVDITYSH